MTTYQKMFMNSNVLTNSHSKNTTVDSYYGSYAKNFGGFPELVNSEPTTKEEDLFKDSKKGIHDVQFEGEEFKFMNLTDQIHKYHGSLLETQPPKLSKKAEEQLAKSVRMINVAEGNLHSSVPGAKSLLITSLFPREGKTTASIFLAYSLAVLSGRRILLIDANFRNPKIHLFFNVVYPCSILYAIQDLTFVPRSILPTKYDNLYIMPHSITGSVRIGLTKENIQKFIKSVQGSFEYLVIDSVALTSGSDSILLAQCVDAVLFVVECESTKWEVVQEGIEKVFSVNGKVGGVILNKRRYYLPQWIYKII